MAAEQLDIFCSGAEGARGLLIVLFEATYSAARPWRWRGADVGFQQSRIASTALDPPVVYIAIGIQCFLCIV